MSRNKDKDRFFSLLLILITVGRVHGAESFSLLSRRCRTRQYQTEPALMAARSPNELIMERKAPTRTKEMTFFSLLNIRQWEGIDYRSVEEKFTSTLQKGLQS